MVLSCPFFTQISGRNFLPELCGEVHPKSAPLQALRSAHCSTEQSTFRGGKKGDNAPRKGEEEGWPAKGAKRKKGRVKTGQFKVPILAGFGVLSAGFGVHKGNKKKKHKEQPFWERFSELCPKLTNRSTNVREALMGGASWMPATAFSCGPHDGTERRGRDVGEEIRPLKSKIMFMLLFFLFSLQTYIRGQVLCTPTTPPLKIPF